MEDRGNVLNRGNWTGAGKVCVCTGNDSSRVTFVCKNLWRVEEEPLLSPAVM